MVIYAYPDMINTPKYNNGKSVALQVVAVQVNAKLLSSPLWGAEAQLEKEVYEVRSTLLRGGGGGGGGGGAPQVVCV